MQVSAVNSAAFRAAKVESPSPLVSGDWQFISDKPSKATTPKKESHWLRNTIFWIAGIAVATAAFVKLRNTKSIQAVMDSNVGFKGQEGIGKKALWCLGKVGDGAYWLKGKTWDKIAGIFSKAKTAAADVTEEAAETVTEATV